MNTINMTATDPRQWRRELAEQWSALRAGLRAVKGNNLASAILRHQLRSVERTHACLRGRE